MNNLHDLETSLETWRRVLLSLVERTEWDNMIGGRKLSVRIIHPDGSEEEIQIPPPKV